MRHFLCYKYNVSQFTRAEGVARRAHALSFDPPLRIQFLSTTTTSATGSDPSEVGLLVELEASARGAGDRVVLVCPPAALAVGMVSESDGAVAATSAIWTIATGYSISSGLFVRRCCERFLTPRCTKRERKSLGVTKSNGPRPPPPHTHPDTAQREWPLYLFSRESLLLDVRARLSGATRVPRYFLKAP